MRKATWIGRAALVVAGPFLLLSCAGQPLAKVPELATQLSPTAPAATVSPATRLPGAANHTPPTVATLEPEPAVLIIEDAAQLAALEAQGLSAGEAMFGRKGRSTRDLVPNDGWRTIVGTIADDMDTLYRDDKSYGVGMRFAHRGFDPSWLVSDVARFELAAVVNRVDRRAFQRDAAGAPVPDACAELARPAALQRCDAAHPCRPDYVCARTKAGEGACLPPYFVLQMRVDGHPLTTVPEWRGLLASP